MQLVWMSLKSGEPQALLGVEAEYRNTTGANVTEQFFAIILVLHITTKTESFLDGTKMSVYEG